MQVIQCGIGGLENVPALVFPPSALHAEIIPGGGNKLPGPRRAGMGVSKGIKSTFYDWQQGQFQRHIAGFGLLDDVVQVAF